MATQTTNGRAGTYARERAHRHVSPIDLGPMPALQPTCPSCGGSLELLQPDTTRGDALLGACPSCPAWYFIDLGSGGVFDLHVSSQLLSGSVLAELPA